MQHSTLVIAREAERCQELLALLRENYPKLEVLFIPVIETVEIPFQEPALSQGKIPFYLFTSPRAVENYFSAHHLPPHSEVGAIGKATQQALQRWGQVSHFVSGVETSKGTAPQLLAYLKGKEGERAIVQPTSDLASDYLKEYLGVAGVEYHKVIAYSVRPHSELQARLATLEPTPSWVLFFSPSGVKAWSQATPHKGKALSVGPVTTKALLSLGWKEVTECQSTHPNELFNTISGLLQP